MPTLDQSTYCIEYFYAKNGWRDKLIENLLALVAPTKNEPGCLQYDLLLDNQDPNLIILIVKFSSQAALTQHEKQSYIQNFADHTLKKYCEKFTWHYAKEIMDA